MAAPTIYIAITDDWEIRGDGSGDIEEIQLAPLRKLLSIYDCRGIPSTVMAEMMQQLAFRAAQKKHPELKPLADAWDEHVVDAYRRGHDVQLHIHSQWSDHDYVDGRWRLRGSWMMLGYSRKMNDRMVRSGKEYLEQLLRTVDPDYRCRAFRASASAIGPSETLLPVLAENGIELDISIIGGYRIKTKNVDIDFRGCEEGDLPYYPRMTDARRISERREPIVCLPVFQFRGSRLGSAAAVTAKAVRKFRSGSISPGYSDDHWAPVDKSKAGLILDKIVSPVIKGEFLIADLAKLGSTFLPEVLPAARRRARRAGLSEYPVVLTNHAKNVRDFDAIARFADELASAADVRCVTLSEMADKISTGVWPVKVAA